MFTKMPKELTKSDIERIILEKWKEGDTLEFKGGPREDSSGDTFDQLRDLLTKEVVAFANAHGGWIFAGIDEDGQSKGTASRLSPIPRCEDAAERLSRAFQDVIDPRLPILHCSGVPTTEDGAGIIALYVPRSRLAPHRQNTKKCKESFYRRGEESKPMTMREIQDLTLFTYSAAGRTNETFSNRGRIFQKSFRGPYSTDEICCGIRISMVPMETVQQQDIASEGKPRAPFLRVKCQNTKIHTDGPDGGDYSGGHERWRPVLRGVTIDNYKDHEHSVGTSRRLVQSDGLIEYYLHTKKQEWGHNTRELRLYASWVFGAVCNALVASDIFWRQLQTYPLEYGMAVEIISSDDDIRTYDFAKKPYGQMPYGQTLFPKYSVANRADFPNVVKLFESDFWNSVGQQNVPTFDVDFEEIFRSLGT